MILLAEKKIPGAYYLNMFRLVILYLIVTVKANLDSPTIQISSGKIQGQCIQSTIIGKPYYSFRGIPYAEPPVGKLRFQPPVKPKPWTKILDTKTDGSKCVQVLGGSEDCLFLNVFTPTLPSAEEKSELLPVMVYIHGGSFVSGSSNSESYGPEYLISKNIVLVLMNYRLNIFGFLNALDESAPGNAGLKDQVAALEWVQENIEKFSGDPKKVTIFGFSAGAASVQYLLQSNLVKGLFHKAIMQSGSTLNNWAFEHNPMELNHKLANLLNIDTKNVTEFIISLQNLSSQEMLNASINKAVVDHKHRVIIERFVPSLERDSPKAFLTENSYTVLAENKINDVPIMVGYVTNEALLYLEDIATGQLKLTEYENNPTLLVPTALHINNDSESLKSVTDEIKNQYFNDVSITNITAFINHESDEGFVRGIRKSVELLRKDNDVYFYIFGYKDKKETSEYPGVTHGAEEKYLFYTGVEESAGDKLIREKMTTLWTNFAMTGNPTPNEDPVLENVKWPTVSKTENDKLQYLFIEEHLQIKENPGQENFKFWEKVFQRYGNPPFSIY